MVFILNKQKQPLAMTSNVKARRLLKQSKAVVHRMVPFVIRLKDNNAISEQGVELRLDPGAKTTGICINEHKKVMHFVVSTGSGLMPIYKLTMEQLRRANDRANSNR